MRIKAHCTDTARNPIAYETAGRPKLSGTAQLLRWFSTLSVLCLALILSVNSGAVAQNSLNAPVGNHQTITLACNPFPPAKIAENANQPGYDVEILRAAFASRNISLLTPFYPWKRAYFLAQTGQVDGLCSCSYLPEREADFLYSDTLGHVRVSLYATNKEVLETVDRIEDARNMTVGVVNGYNLETSAREAGVDVIMANSETTLVNLLLSRRLDAVLSFRAPMDYLLNVKNDGIPNASTIKSKILSNDPYYSCIARKTEHADRLMTELNVGLAAIRKNGLYDTIMEKYGILSDISQ
jgi:polar amino acid transport system substrate-binding protein